MYPPQILMEIHKLCTCNLKPIWRQGYLMRARSFFGLLVENWGGAAPRWRCPPRMQKVNARKRPFLGENSAERRCAAILVCAPLPRGPAVRSLSFSKLNLFNKHIIQQEEEEEFDYRLCGRSKSNSSSSSSCTMCFLNKFNLLIRPRLMSTKNKNRESKTRKPNPSNPHISKTQKPKPQPRSPQPTRQNPRGDDRVSPSRFPLVSETEV